METQARRLPACATMPRSPHRVTASLFAPAGFSHPRLKVRSGALAHEGAASLAASGTGETGSAVEPIVCRSIGDVCLSLVTHVKGLGEPPVAFPVTPPDPN